MLHRLQLLIPVCVIALVVVALAGCAKLESRLERARVADLDEREEIYEELEEWTIDLLDEKDDSDYGRLNAFYIERFESEPDPRLRSQILSLAVQGQFPCAETLVNRGITDRGGRIVQILALQYARLYDLSPNRERIRVVLEGSDDPMVRVEAIRTMSAAAPSNSGDARRWAEPLVDVFLDPTEKTSVRELAYDGAKKLTGSSLGRRDYDRWATWRRASIGLPGVGDGG